MNLEEYRFPRVKNELKYVYDTINETIKLLVKYIFYTHHVLMVITSISSPDRMPTEASPMNARRRRDMPKSRAE